MTDPACPAVSIAPEFADWAKAAAERDQLAREALAQNKTVLLDALALTGITQVTVTFDGYGDSGQAESIAARIGDDDVPLPGTIVEIVRVVWGMPEPEHSSVSLEAAIEALSYDVLECTHCGWENNDGAYGDVVFDVAERVIELDYNERFTSSENHTHAF